MDIAHSPWAFLIRLQRMETGLRGEIVAVETGVSRLFNDLWDLMAYIEAQTTPGAPAGGGEDPA